MCVCRRGQRAASPGGRPGHDPHGAGRRGRARLPKTLCRFVLNGVALGVPWWFSLRPPPPPPTSLRPGRPPSCGQRPQPSEGAARAGPARLAARPALSGGDASASPLFCRKFIPPTWEGDPDRRNIPRNRNCALIASYVPRRAFLILALATGQ